MRWLILLLFVLAVPVATAATISVCYNYGCLAEAPADYSEQQLAQVRDLIAAADSAAAERDRLALAIGWLLAWAGQQTPIAADRGGNRADDGGYGRMDCIDHATTTTRLLRLFDARGWLHFHRVLEPVRRVRYLFAVHFSAQIEEIDGRRETTAGGSPNADPARFVVDSWFRDNGQPAVVMALPDWLDGEGREETAQLSGVADRPDDGWSPSHAYEGGE
ncbi:MAG: hypothetical protein V5B33_06855 [Candidatus Accumulibacter sp. UW20]|jgi:hypothetical protein